ncbi:hypothetical protein PI125_g16413 [Phytophthora idaei]|nr:hypothetical protein PI125_g16413 [Phytophthora idaei]
MDATFRVVRQEEASHQGNASAVVKVETRRARKTLQSTTAVKLSTASMLKEVATEMTGGEADATICAV